MSSDKKTNDVIVPLTGVGAYGQIGRVAPMVETRGPKRPGGKHEYEVRKGFEFDSNDNMMRKTRIIDRTNDRYIEHVTNDDTGAVVHDVDESLSQHWDHGSAKAKKPALNNVWKPPAALAPTVLDCEPWSHVIIELAYHQKQGTKHAWNDTLNRLMRESTLANARGDVIMRHEIPKLVPQSLRASKQQWTMEQLLDARSATPHDRDAPICDWCPILVLRLFGMSFLVDGGTRMNRRIRDNDRGPHTVVVIDYVPPL